jgi:hypothetical protein
MDIATTHGRIAKKIYSETNCRRVPDDTANLNPFVLDGSRRAAPGTKSTKTAASRGAAYGAGLSKTTDSRSNVGTR